MNHSKETYTCEKCGGTFEKDVDWTEEDAEAEMRRDFGEIDKSDKAIVCDDCYNRFMAQWKPQTN